MNLKPNEKSPGRSRVSAWMGIWLLASSLAISVDAQSAGERRTLSGHVPKAVARLSALERITGDKKVRLAIGLPLRDDAGLKRELQELYDPASPNFHQYLTPEQFTARYGPTKEDYQAVMDFARTNGFILRQTHPNRLLVEVEGTVADVERTFQVKLNYYQHPTENRHFFAPDSEPSVPVNVPVLTIEGLSDYVVPHPHGLQARPPLAYAKYFPTTGSGPSGAFIAGDIRAAYVPGVTNLGAGQKVALAEWEGYYTNDVYLYETNANLSTNIVITNIVLAGASALPDGNTQDNYIEPPLDIEAVIDMAPAAAVLVYIGFFPSGITNYYLPATVTDPLYNRIATDNQARQISTSWYTGIDATADQIFEEYAAQGQSFFNAAGDSGAMVGDIPPPSDDPYITEVGGTILTTTGPKGAWSSETTWQLLVADGYGSFSASSGGYSDIYEMPGWQQGMNMVNNRGSSTMRNFPDVSIEAMNNLCFDNGIQEVGGGSSFAAPLWAGFIALVNQQAANTGKPPVGFINPAIYSIALGSDYNKAFHDIITGSNVNFTTTQTEWSAGPGFDLCTGLGTPTGSNLITALLASPDPLVVVSNTAFTASGAVGGPFNYTSQSYSISNQGSASLTWSNINPVSWLQVSTNHGTLAVGGTNLVALSLSSTASTLAAGIYTATVWFTNLTSHYAQSRQFALRVGQPVLQNGGFEDGDVSDWLLTGDYAGYYDYVYASSGAFSGNYYMVFEHNSRPLATLSQTLPTLTGQYYSLSYWLRHPTNSVPAFTNEFKVSWNGTTLRDLVNVPTFVGWSNFQFRVLATGPSSQLTFGADNDQDYFGLDNVSFTPTNGPPVFSHIGLTNQTITLTWFTTPSTNYQLQYIKSLPQNNWSNLGSSFTATGSTATATDSHTNSQRFYRVVATP